MFLLLLLVAVCTVMLVSSLRFYRRRHHWPLSSPDSTRHPLLLCALTAMLAAWAALHLIRQILNEQMPCVAYVFASAIILQVNTTRRRRRRNPHVVQEVRGSHDDPEPTILILIALR